jgi:hypothetical protein
MRRIPHRVAGEKLFVAYWGHTMVVTDALTGELLTAKFFVAVLVRPTSGHNSYHPDHNGPGD